MHSGNVKHSLKLSFEEPAQDIGLHYNYKFFKKKAGHFLEGLRGRLVKKKTWPQ